MPCLELSPAALRLIALIPGCDRAEECEIVRVIEAIVNYHEKAGRRDCGELPETPEGLSRYGKAAYEACIADDERGIERYWKVARVERGEPDTNRGDQVHPGGEAVHPGGVPGRTINKEINNKEIEEEILNISDIQQPSDASRNESSPVVKKEASTGAKQHKPRFTPPTVEEVRTYCRERNNTVDPERFVDHYNSNGWMVGKNHMKDWKAAVRTWEQNQKGGNRSGYSGGNSARDSVPWQRDLYER